MADTDATSEIVLDTNVLLDAWLFGDPSAQPLLGALAAGTLRWVATEPMLAELAHVLARPLPDRWEARRQAALAFDFRAQVTLVQAPSALPASEALACSDPDDQKFIDLAMARRCRWLVSRDRALLRLGRRAARFGVAVVRPDGWRPV